MIVDERESRLDYVLETARAMMAAARTAPKGKGTDRIETVTVYGGDSLARLAAEMRRQSEQRGFKFFLRDADNVEAADAVVLIGTSYGTFGLDCGYCGFDTCAEKQRFGRVPCAFNMNDLGIAQGSAVSVAADRRVDNRIMWSAAAAAKSLGMIEGCDAVFAILLSCTGKNPFFDRKTPSAG